jgi:hypothetical protein
MRVSFPLLRSYCIGRLLSTPVVTPPGSIPTEAFIGRELPNLLLASLIRVLETGCGSGSLTQLLASFGYCGIYVGMDVVTRLHKYVT